tara:strand:- start:12266 stop:14404 length:2139 start_codon:yes stop_codon:yes gene_type:complete
MSKLKLSRTHHQCVLTHNLFEFADQYKKRHEGGDSPKHHTVILGDSTRARTHLSSFAEAEPLMDLTQGQLSALVPKIQLSKQVNSESPFIDFHFDEFHRASLFDVTESQRNRGVGAGIKSINVNMEGDAIATSDRQYKVTIEFYFASVRELFIERESENGKYKYEDLITPFRLPSGDKPTASCLEKTQYGMYAFATSASVRYKLEFGYATPPPSNLFTENELVAIERAKRSIMLNLYKHEVNFEENGTMSITAEYHGYVEKAMSRVDILRMGLTTSEQLGLQNQERGLCNRREYDRRKQEEDNPPPSNQPGSKCADDARPKPKVSKGWYEEYTDDLFGDDDDAEEREDKIAEVRTRGYKSFMRGILTSGRVYSLKLRDYSQRPVVSRIDAKTGKIKGLNLELGRAKVGRNSGPRSSIMNYFFLGDMFDTIFEFCRKQTGVDINFTLGTVSIRDKTTNVTRSIPIAAIPISVKHFENWFVEHVVKKGERQTYNLLDFIRDMMNNLVKSAFSPQCYKDPKTETIVGGLTVPKFEINTFTTKEDYTGQVTHFSNIDKKKLNPVSIGNAKIYTNYFVYGVDSNNEKSTESASFSEDRENGIFHLISGTEIGLTKRINFSKDDMKYATEATMEKGNMGKTGILWGKYDAEVELFGNPMFKPGMKVYVASNSMTPEEIRRIGMGGYYYVTKVYNSISSGKYTTELTCKFHNTPNTRQC